MLEHQKTSFLRRVGYAAVFLALALLIAAANADPGKSGKAPRGLSATEPMLLCRPIKILDGDSLELACGAKRLEVRLHCIDSPEWDQRPWGQRARKSLESMTSKRLKLRPIERDRFGRIVGDLFTDDGNERFINLALVEQGAAAVYRRFCSDHGFDRAEKRARDEKRGIWRTPGLHQRPWIFRRGRPSGTSSRR